MSELTGNNSFHNTIQADDQLALHFEAEALTQEEKVLGVFKFLNRPLAWFEVSKMLEMNECSLKRSITNLCSKGELVKDTQKSNMVAGPSGKACHRYQILNKV